MNIYYNFAQYSYEIIWSLFQDKKIDLEPSENVCSNQGKIFNTSSLKWIYH